MARKKKYEYYDIKSLLKLGDTDPDIRYFLSFGERSAGKSYSTSRVVIENYWINKKISGIARRWDDDWGQNVAATYFDGLIGNKEIEKITGGVWSSVWYYGHKWYLSRWDDEKDKLIKDKTPFAYAFALNTWEKTKSSQYPEMNLLVFEEFISYRYIGAENGEFKLFLNLVSTLARERSDFRCILLGNSIAKYGNPYFICMGIEKRVLKLEPGQKIVFSSDTNKLKIAVEFTPPGGVSGEGKESDILFEFTDNATARMITSGAWQIEEHFPSLPEGTRIRPCEIKFRYFLIYRDSLLEGDVIIQGNKYYTFFHRKTTEIKDPEKSLIYDLDYHLEPNYRRDITMPTDTIGKKIAQFFANDAVYCQDVEVGEILYSYLQGI